jgi:hypothetical protein
MNCPGHIFCVHNPTVYALQSNTEFEMDAPPPPLASFCGMAVLEFTVRQS